MAARPSEIRAFLLRYAGKRGILVKEYTSEPGEGVRTCFFCHLQAPPKEPYKTATALSYEHGDNALVMAFLNYANSELDFLPE